MRPIYNPIIHLLYCVESSPRGISDGAVIVDPDGGGLGVVGGHPQGLGLVNEHVRHPEPGGFVRVEGEVVADRVFSINVLRLGNYSAILKCCNKIILRLVFLTSFV